MVGPPEVGEVVAGYASPGKFFSVATPYCWQIESMCQIFLPVAIPAEHPHARARASGRRLLARQLEPTNPGTGVFEKLLTGQVI